MSPLKRYRIDAGLTINKLSELSGVGGATISSLERGGGAKVSNLVKLAAVLSEKLGEPVRPSDLLDSRPKAAA